MTLRKISILTILVLAISMMMFAAPDVKWDGKMKMTPTKPKVGDKVIFSAFFLIKGGAQRGLQIQGGVDGVVVKNKTYALAKDNLRKVIKFDWTATAGSHKAWFKLDPNKKLKDSNRANNYIEITFTVPGEEKPKPKPDPEPETLPDLTVILLNSSDNAPTANKQFLISTEIKNIGKARVATVPGVVLEINGSRYNTELPIPPLFPGQIKYFSWKVTLANPGSYTFTIIADKDNSTPESDDTNNTKSITLKVSKAGGSGTSGMPRMVPGGVVRTTEEFVPQPRMMVLDPKNLKPNLVIDKIKILSGNALSGQVFAGEKFSLEVVFQNIGTAPDAGKFGSHFVEVFLNNNRAIKMPFGLFNSPVGVNQYKAINVQHIPTSGLDPNKPLVMVKAVLDGDSSKSTIMGLMPSPDLVVTAMKLKMNCVLKVPYDPVVMFKDKNNRRCGGVDPWEGVLTLTVKNIGNADVTKTTRMHVQLLDYNGSKSWSSQPYIPAIAKGDSYDMKWTFTHGCDNSSITAATYVRAISWEVDSYRDVKESNESNNKGGYSGIVWPYNGSSNQCGSVIQAGGTK